MNIYKKTLTEADRAEIDEYCDDLIVSSEAVGLREEYYTDTSAGARIDMRAERHNKKISIAVRMKTNGDIIHKTYSI